MACPPRPTRKAAVVAHRG
uniref:Uncharacterized protein n=1 Tax=Arundo donax TaxID=35708 RepID=A0A0A8ZMY7_ARUDO